MKHLAILTTALVLSGLGAAAQSSRYDLRDPNYRPRALSDPITEDAPRGSTLNTTPVAGGQASGPLDSRTQPGMPATYGR